MSAEKPSLTEQAQHSEARSAWNALGSSVARIVSVALLEAKPRIEVKPLARRMGVGPTLIGKWLTDGAHVPLAVLAHPAMPAALVARIIGETLALRVEGGSKTTREGAVAALIRACCDAISAASQALADGKISDDEHATLRPIIEHLRAWCERYLREHPPLSAKRGDA